MVKTNITTVTLDGTETAVQFDKNYTHFWLSNIGDSAVYAALNEGVTPDADGVLTVPAGSAACTMHGYGADTLYLSGTGKVQVLGAYSADCPFKANKKGGGNSGALDFIELDCVENEQFTAEMEE